MIAKTTMSILSQSSCKGFGFPKLPVARFRALKFSGQLTDKVVERILVQLIQPVQPQAEKVLAILRSSLFANELAKFLDSDKAKKGKGNRS